MTSRPQLAGGRIRRADGLSETQSIRRYLQLSGRLLAVIALCGLASITAQGCSCVDTSKSEAESIKSSFKWAAAVFVGTPVELTVQQGELQIGNRTIPYENYHVRIAVNEAFKGMSSHYAVSDTGGPTDCSFGKMEIGKAYIIYGTMSDDSKVEFGACNPTHMIPPEDWKRERKRTAKELALLRKLSRSR